MAASRMTLTEIMTDAALDVTAASTVSAARALAENSRRPATVMAAAAHRPSATATVSAGAAS